MKIAIIHDFLIQYGGAEKVLQALLDIYPDADLYTLVYDKEKISKYFTYDKKIFVSKLQKYYDLIKRINFTGRNSQKFLIFWDIIKYVELIDLSKYDIVISNNSLFSKSVITKPTTFHVVYMNTGPSRLLWDEHFTYINQNKLSFLSKIYYLFIKYKTHKWRLKDKISADRADLIIANSNIVKFKIYKYYKRSSYVIYPPVDIIDNIKLSEIIDKDYYLVVSRLTSTKNIDLVIKTFNKINKKLIIVGEGDQMSYLKSIANKNIKFVGHKTKDELINYYKYCKAVIFPSDDDFGIVPIEAMSFGKPVIAYNKGGAKETVISGITGEFFDDLSENSLINCINLFEQKKYDSLKCIQQSQKFSLSNFKNHFYNYVNEQFNLFKNK